MSADEEDKFMERIEKWDAKHARQDFLQRMERKLYRKKHVER